ncbi:hypothetical protein [Legionella sp. PC997]|uniref:hypothetical protein n=1 Tax=Legionella sp. PC997 TaxID=2755562 RepID=UPI0015FA40D9|nr:hypothetical protein [Legionella sp. PC997]QMT61896.1 hypothetical protein HBNCFIEN_03304 [Legionella sp. PC997]
MADPKLHKRWRNDKAKFFKTPLSINIEAAIEETQYRATALNYQFILENQKIIEAEFLDLFAVLQKQRNESDEKNKVFWLYCYYCATLLEQFHKAYSQQNKEEEYKKFKEQIRNYLLGIKDSAEEEEAFLESLINGFKNSLYNLLSAPAHSSRMREYLAFINLCRLQWVFTRLTLVSGFSLAKELHWLDNLDYSILGPNTNVDQVIGTLNAANGILSYFSVGLFLGTLLIDTATLIKHTFFPAKGEGKNTPEEIWARFKYEIFKRHGSNANDLVWSVVNFMTNLNHITHIPDPTAGIITGIFLGFDVSMTLYKCYLARQEYVLKTSQYETEIRTICGGKSESQLTIEQQARVNVLKKQIIEEEIKWQIKERTFYFNASAAALLMIGFTASLALSGPAAPVVCFFICTIAVAMYRSSGAFNKYQENSLRLDHAVGTERALAEREFEAARKDFYFTLIKNTVVPIFLITAWATCWPVGLAFTVLYLGCELSHAYNQHCSKNEDPEALEKPNSVSEHEYDKLPLLTVDDSEESCYCM